MRFADVPVGAYFRFVKMSPSSTLYRKIEEYTLGRKTFNAELPRPRRPAGHWFIDPEDEVQVVVDPV